MKEIYYVNRMIDYPWGQEYQPIAVYPDKEQAEQHARLANSACKNFDKLRGEPRSNFLKDFPYDKIESEIDYGLEYSVESLPFVCHVDEYMDRRWQ